MPEQLPLYVAALAVAAVASGAATAFVLRLLRERAILDRPNARSSHAEPVPRGGGIAVVAVIAAGVLAAMALYDAALVPAAVALVAMLGLAVVSWIDDLRTLAAAPRLAAQAAAVAAVLAVWPADNPALGGIVPPWADRLAAGVAWLWFVNLFNFMDGMDGMAGTETAAIGIGLAGLSLAAGLAADVGMLGAVAAGAALGFLWFNRPPARIFLGDVGSVPLGFALGWLLLRTAAEGLWVPALVLPLYFLADATITLLRRAARGERVWRAHREHFYQQALARGWSHRRVLLPVAAADAGLVALAWLGADWPWLALAAAALVVALLLAVLAGQRGVRAGTPE